MLPISKVKKIVLEMKIECSRENNCSKTKQIFKEYHCFKKELCVMTTKPTLKRISASKCKRNSK
jgi:hypothetical protein